MAAPSDIFYRRVLRPLLFRLDPELSHRLTLAMLQPAAMLREPAPDPPALAMTPWGIRFSNPIGLAAGMDKDIRAVAGWQAVGFGFAELGTVTPLAAARQSAPAPVAAARASRTG